MQHSPTLAVLALALAPTDLGAQVLQPPAGYAAEIVYQERSVPYAISGFAVDPLQGDLYVSVFHEVLRIDAQGIPHLVHGFAKGQSTGLMTVLPQSFELAYGNLNTNTLYLRDLLRGTVRSLPLPANCYDLIATPGGSLLCTANPRWPQQGAHTGVFHYTGSSWREIIQLRGPSGPLAMDDRGNLLYATQASTYPTPKGAVDLLRFAAGKVRAAMQGGPALQWGAGQVVIPGLDGASDMIFDDRGRLVIADPIRGGLRRTQPGLLRLEGTDFVRTGPVATISLQLTHRGPGEMDAWQPGGAGLFVHTSDWLRTAEIQRISPARPKLRSTVSPQVPPGAFAVELAAAPAQGRALLALSAHPLLSTEQVLFRELGTACWMGLDLSLPFVLLAQPIDARGLARFALHNPGGLQLSLRLQALAIGNQPGRLGTSDPLSLSILP